MSGQTERPKHRLRVSFVGYVDSASNSIMVADTDYLESPKTQEVNGVYYPQWSDNEFVQSPI